MKGVFNMKIYYLYGFLNMFKIVPDFVFPVFMHENILYIQEGENNTITSMVPLEEALYDKVVSINKYDIICQTKKQFIISSFLSPQYAFQTSQQEIIYGSSMYLQKFFRTYQTNDPILKQEIRDFIMDNLLATRTALIHNTTPEKKESLTATIARLKSSSKKSIAVAYLKTIPSPKHEKTKVAQENLCQTTNDKVLLSEISQR